MLQAFSSTRARCLVSFVTIFLCLESQDLPPRKFLTYESRASPIYSYIFVESFAGEFE
jgi:hypothetical protein